MVRSIGIAAGPVEPALCVVAVGSDLPFVRDSVSSTSAAADRVVLV